jgi:hypothetical protein
MIKAPDLAAIYAAELKLAEARIQMLDGGRRAWLAVKVAVTRPSSLALIAAAGFCGGWLVSRRSARPEPRAGEATAAGKGVIAGLIFPFLLQAASRILPLVVSGAFTERKKADEPCTVVQTTVIHDGTA